MLNNLFILVIYQFAFLILRKLYKSHIEKKYSYKIPTKGGFQGLVDRNEIYQNKEARNNKLLMKEVNHLFLAELSGVFIMILGAIYFLLV